MTTPTIAWASSRIDELIEILDNAYWEAATIDHKDMLFSIITLLHAEQRELDKLSIQDHGLAYEPISSNFRELKAKLSLLRNRLEDIAPRSQTSRGLERVIPQVESLLF